MTLHRSPGRSVQTSSLCLSYEAREHDRSRGTSKANRGRQPDSPRYPGSGPDGLQSRTPSSARLRPRHRETSAAPARSLTPSQRNTASSSSTQSPSAASAERKLARFTEGKVSVGLDVEVLQAERDRQVIRAAEPSKTAGSTSTDVGEPLTAH